jgi:hypothetical protein
MKHFIDTEFYEDGKTIDLISIGIVAEDGREFYAVSKDAQLHRVSDWVRSNVLNSLPTYDDPAWMSREEIKNNLQWHFEVDVKRGDEPEVWGYYSDYDWIVLCQIYGTMMDLPDYMPRFCRDLKQLS